jgi:hypothetical protein
MGACRSSSRRAAGRAAAAAAPALMAAGSGACGWGAREWVLLVDPMGKELAVQPYPNESLVPNKANTV